MGKRIATVRAILYPSFGIFSGEVPDAVAMEHISTFHRTSLSVETPGFSPGEETRHTAARNFLEHAYGPGRPAR
ncbi:hypothetical protein [Streptosporangium canum]|uniref:hypothetical protein n=1 Tax=Streptosporangium canum TaxID=324952 RepID=UPI00342D7F9E